MSVNRREFLKMLGGAAGVAVFGDLFLAACAPAPADVPVVTPNNSPAVVPGKPTPFADNKPSYPKTPTAADLKPGIWFSAFNAFLNPETKRALNELDTLFPDPLVRNRVAQVLVENDLAAKPGGTLQIFETSRKNGQIIGSTLCADSRVICDTIYYTSDTGKVIPQFAAIEERSLGAAPRVFERGINVSILATHCNSAGDISGCGALQALAKLQEPGGTDYLLHHGIAQDTIDEVLRTLKVAKPDEQAVIAAKLQAMVNTFEHGGESHITVAVKMGHADKYMEVIDAFDNFGNRVPLDKLPEYAREFLAVNGSKATQIDAFLARGQQPFEYVLNATDKNIQQLMGKGTEVPGKTFKITASPQVGNLNRALNADEIKRAVAALNYPLTHDWGKIQWILAKSPEELALIRSELYRSDKFWQFLARGNTIVEAVIDGQGKISGAINITRLNDVAQPVRGIEGVRMMGTSSEVILAQRALNDAQKIIKEAAASEATAFKYQPIIDKLRGAGKIGLKVLNFLTPLFNAGAVIEISNTLQRVAKMDIVYDTHALQFDGYGRKGAIAKIPTTSEYQNLMRINPNLEPILAVEGIYDTSYSPEELAGAFRGLVNRYIQDKGVFGSDTDLSPKKPSEFNGVQLGDLYKILIFDYTDPIQNQKQIKLAPVKNPLILYPLPVSTSSSPSYIDYGDGLSKQPFMIMNTNTGEFVITGMEGEMIVPVQSLEPKNGVAVTYYLYLKTDKSGKLYIKNVGYSDPTGRGAMGGKEYIVVSEPGELGDGVAGVNLSQRLPVSDLIYAG